MVDIYENSYLTIAATQASNASEGLFMDSTIHASRTLIHQFPGQQDSVELFTRKLLNHKSTLPLLSRAWGFQERLLSPRVVHFTDSELQWECLKMSDCECSALMNSHSYYSEYKTRMSPQTMYTHGHPKDYVSRHWRSLVSEYSGLSFSYQKDIFPALQGLTKATERMHVLLGCVEGAIISTKKPVYLAGL